MLNSKVDGIKVCCLFIVVVICVITHVSSHISRQQVKKMFKTCMSAFHFPLISTWYGGGGGGCDRCQAVPVILTIAL